MSFSNENEWKIDDSRTPLKDVPKSFIENIEFSVMSTKDIDNMSVIDVTSTADLNSGLMGPIRQSGPCETCGNSWTHCSGHFGSIKLPNLIHPLYRSHVTYILTSVCNDCGKCLIPRKVLERYPEYVNLPADKKLKFVREKVNSKKNVTCPYIDDAHDCDDNRKSCGINPKYQAVSNEGKEKVKVNLQYTTGASSAGMNRTPDEILHILNAIDDETAELLGFNPKVTHPRNLIINRLVVLPHTLRSEITFGSANHSNEITSAYSGILTKLNDFRKAEQVAAVDSSQLGNKEQKLSELYRSVFNFIKDTGLVTPGNRGNKFKGIFALISGKEGIARQETQGKRVRNVGRSVATPASVWAPDGNKKMIIRVDEVGVPKIMARELTRKLTVVDFNIEQLQKDLDSGLVRRIKPVSGRFKGFTISVDDSSFKRHYRGYQLRLGDEVVRQLKDGDYVMYHRGPTLETSNFLVLKAKITEEDVNRVNPSIVNAMNLDFDGDETQVHVLQTPEAYAEAVEIMGIHNNFVSYSTGRAFIALTYDALLGCYLLTEKEVEISQSVYDYCTEEIRDSPQWSTLESRLKKYNVERMSGRGMFSACLPEGFYFNKKGVVVRDGILVSGVIKKNTVGTVSGGFMTEIRHQIREGLITHEEAAIEFVTNARSVASRYLQVTGFSIGLDDISLSDSADFREKQENVFMSYFNESVRTGQTILSEDDSTRVRLANAASFSTRDNNLVVSALSKEENNNLMKAVNSGAKGSAYNVHSISGAVGQQIVNGKTASLDFPGKRSLPSFQMRDEGDIEVPIMRGFSKHSFSEGLDVVETFFQQASAREALVKSSRSTKDTGNLERIVIKCCEDINIGVGRTTVGAKGLILQCVYGGDGFDPRNSEFIDGSRIPRDYEHIANVLNMSYMDSLM